ncbi:Uncharacterised protein [Mycobacteroides abscessus subsp. abscessus]|nr:Uncharacterised protein [Mycobacteroides abscessus subsp. abscessus]SKV52811.1 Uncharacterised protein [Mycobacteroides abscessus subsp. abscessus]
MKPGLQTSGGGQRVIEIGGQVQEFLDFVDIDHHRVTLRLGDGGAFADGLPQFAEHHRRQQPRSFRPQHPFLQGHQQNLLLVEHLADVEAWLALGQDCPQVPIQQGSHLIG